MFYYSFLAWQQQLINLWKKTFWTCYQSLGFVGHLVANFLIPLEDFFKIHDKNIKKNWE